MIWRNLLVSLVFLSAVRSTDSALTTSRNRPPASILDEKNAAAGPMVESEFIFQSAPFASAHASTIVETNAGLVAAWFGGTREGAADVAIRVSRHVDGAWTRPVEVANGMQPDGTRDPCWNPVLLEMPDRAPWPLSKVGPSPPRAWGMV